MEGWLFMNASSSLPVSHDGIGINTTMQVRSRKAAPAPLPIRFAVPSSNPETQNRHAELFYLQKQIQSQTPMVIVLEDGERIEGCIEWYDRSALKVRGRAKTLIYKSAIKYMYKVGDSGQ